MIAEATLPAPDIGARIKWSLDIFEPDIRDEIIRQVLHIKHCTTTQARWDKEKKTGQKPVERQDAADRGHHVCPTLQ